MTSVVYRGHKATNQTKQIMFSVLYSVIYLICYLSFNCFLWPLRIILLKVDTIGKDKPLKGQNINNPFIWMEIIVRT